MGNSKFQSFVVFVMFGFWLVLVIFGRFGCLWSCLYFFSLGRVRAPGHWGKGVVACAFPASTRAISQQKWGFVNCHIFPRDLKIKKKLKLKFLVF